MADDLIEIKERLAYAEEEINTVERYLRHFLARNVETRKKPDLGGVTTVMMRCRARVPTNIRIKIGAAIHEIRSSLDALACVLALRNGPDDKNVYFPITKTRAFYVADAKDKLKKVSPQDKAAIDAMAPNGEDRPLLFGMHDLDRTKKHRHLSIKKVANPGLEFGNAVITEMVLDFQEVELTPLWRPFIHLKPGTTIEFAMHSEVRFGEPEHLLDRSVVPSLRQFLAEVRAIVAVFD